MIIPRLDSPSTNEVLSGIDSKAHEKGYQLIITNANQETEREIEDIYTLAKQKVDGIIFGKGNNRRHDRRCCRRNWLFPFLGFRTEDAGYTIDHS
ncbi:MAG: hypothetical protein U5K84_04930 [Alkalibacterium sp.]|nr:hypothetical protein [Alkalibacterium sp.]